jgi:hypothetical protein
VVFDSCIVVASIKLALVPVSRMGDGFSGVGLLWCNFDFLQLVFVL